MMSLKNHYSRKNTVLTFVSALTAGFLTHMFALTNVLQNYDNINASFHGFGNGVESGRWFLTFLSMVMHKFFGGYNLPWFNGVVAIALLSISAAFITSVFYIHRSWSAVLIGVLFVVFPTVSSTLFFRFVSMYDAAAVLLAVFAAWILGRCKFGVLISAGCTAISMGIYQAYFPITVTILIVLLIQETLRNPSIREIVKKGLYYLCCLILGLAAYFIAQKSSQLFFDAELLSYQGISQMGKISIRELPFMVLNAYISFLTFPFENYCNLTPNLLAQGAVICLWVLSAFATGISLVIRKGTVGQWLITVCLWLIFPVAVSLVEIMAPDSHTYTMMVYSFVFVYIAPIILMEQLPSAFLDTVKSGIRKVVAAVAAVTLFILSFVAVNYIYLANVNYTSMYYTTQQTENYMNALVVQVRMTEGYRSSQKWAFIGDSFEDPLLSSPWTDIPKYGGNGDNYINAYSRMRWINTYFGYDIPLAEENTVEALKESDIVKSMPCFPDAGSICIIEDTVVIKLEEIPLN